MIELKIYGQDDLNLNTNPRKGETKLGETMQVLKSKSLDALKDSSARFVLVGLTEDIGVQANHGRPGAKSAWKQALGSVCNIQSNKYLNGNEILVLGSLDASSLSNSVQGLNPKEAPDAKTLYAAVSEVDAFVSNLCKTIIESGKTPIFIGGGHNNAYPLLKGSQLGHSAEDGVNCFNCDPHSDFRAMEGRHSGNGFRYAKEEGILNRYFLMGFHESYNNQESLNALDTMETDQKRVSFDSMYIRNETTLEYQLERAVIFLRNRPTGIEIDLDAVENMPSSAMSSSAFPSVQVRRMVYKLGYSAHCAYLHIAEGAPNFGNKDFNQVGKYIGYLVSDFVKAQNKKSLS